MESMTQTSIQWPFVTKMKMETQLRDKIEIFKIRAQQKMLFKRKRKRYSKDDKVHKQWAKLAH